MKGPPHQAKVVDEAQRQAAMVSVLMFKGALLWTVARVEPIALLASGFERKAEKIEQTS
jgi:hypothetical protein